MDDLLCLKAVRDRKRLRLEVERLKGALAQMLREHEAYRRISEGRVREAEARGRESLLKELFVLLEDVDRLLGVLSEEEIPDNVKEGALSIARKMEHTLRMLGVEKLVPKVGEPFDPSYMEALNVIKSEGLSKGSVGAVYEPGWRYRGKLLKPARVAVVS
ncbi:MAG: nucleotide exchange factor GrpE [Thermotogae bacterium]|nr:nucleotide exchange factor GrpE [Thermotogota bacterium]